MVARGSFIVTALERPERRRLGGDFEAAAADAEFDREIGLDQALAQFRAGREEIKAIPRHQDARRITARLGTSMRGRALSLIRSAGRSRRASPARLRCSNGGMRADAVMNV
jgi:hypothetical protein